jgi:enediyne biosynthesis protein E4
MPDLAMSDPNNLLLQGADGRFTEAAHLAGVADPARSRGAALVDLTGDGRLDLVVVNRRAPARFYRNVTEDIGNWLAVELRMEGGNRFAIGARVHVETAQGAQWQEVSVGGGHAGGQAGALHFGLGQAAQAVIVVDWSDGHQSRAEIDSVNQRVVLTPDG